MDDTINYNKTTISMNRDTDEHMQLNSYKKWNKERMIYLITIGVFNLVNLNWCNENTIILNNPLDLKKYEICSFFYYEFVRFILLASFSIM